VGWPATCNCELEASASLQAAASVALSKLFNRPLDTDAAVAVCLEAQRLSPGLFIGPATAITALAGQAESLLQVRTGPAAGAVPMRLPTGVALLGISCGARHPQAVRKCVDAHLAALMGLRVVTALARFLPNFTSDTAHLGRISVADYVEHLRDRLPTKIKGKVFVERFGPLDDEHVTVDPDTWYKVRSRTEHHIYENARTHQFVERLSRAARTGERAALLEAGELMYASHWSFGQRCGLGGIETDKLVNLLRARGPNDGIFGARTSGLGAGGTVAVLLSDSAQSRRAVFESVAAYQAQTGLTACVLDGSSDGALAVNES
jgi:L-arabinokinase